MNEQKLFLGVILTPWFIVLILALALAFTSCDGNKPSDPGQLNVEEYVGTSWFLDSIDMGSYVSTHMCMPIFITSKNTIQLGNEVQEFEVKDGVLTIIYRYDGETVGSERHFTLVSLSKTTGAVLKEGDHTIYVSAMPTLDRNKQSAISEAALIGKYKQVISSIEETAVDGSKTISYSTGGMILWINLKADHKMVYEDSNPYMDDTQGYWDVKPAERLITMGGVSSYNELISMNHWENIIVFNEDYLVTGEDYDYDGTMGFTHRHYESVLLRVK